jgi:hypothetical protein
MISGGGSSGGGGSLLLRPEQERSLFNGERVFAAAAAPSSPVASPGRLARRGPGRSEEKANAAHGGGRRLGETEPGGEVGDGGRRGRARGSGRAVFAIAAAEKDELLLSRCRRRLLVLQLLLLPPRRCRCNCRPLDGQSVQPAPAAIA